MSQEQLTVIAILVAAFALFVWGRWRYDVVAFGALIAAVVTGVVEPENAFRGFGHPAVITVAAVLIISRALTVSGVVDVLAARVMPETKSDLFQIAVLCGIATVISGFMNNVGALALLMPVAMRAAAKAGRSPAKVLMPLSFASILGGLTTLIGTPPNIIVGAYRREALGEAFGVFAFTPVGATVAVVGSAFVAFLGWRLIPKERFKRKVDQGLFDIEDYVVEARVHEDSPFVGETLRETEAAAEEHGVTIVGLIRKKYKISLDRRRRIESGDLLILEGAPDDIANAVGSLDLKLVAGGKPIEDLSSDDVMVMEAVVAPRSELEGKTPEQIRFRRRLRVNLLAVSRQGKPYRGRIKDFKFEAGDVVLLQGDVDQLPSVMNRIGCLPLAERELQFTRDEKPYLAVGFFALAILATAFGLLPAAVAFGAAVLAMVVSRVISAPDAYAAIDWSVILLLGALIPVGGALETTGATGVFAEGIVGLAGDVPPFILIGVIMIATMTLSDIVNNAATAVVMAPISLGIALQLGVNPDAFLMAVAIGASCAFLTPIGHQNNTLILGPGGYHFGDYWRMGLPLEAIIVALGVPLILIVFPL